MNNSFIKSRIISSLQPKVGKLFNYEDLERKKEEKLEEIRKELISIAIEEKDRDVQSLKTQLNAEKEKMKASSNPPQHKELLQKLESKSAETAKKLNKKANKKVSFHLQQQTTIMFVFMIHGT